MFGHFPSKLGEMSEMRMILLTCGSFALTAMVVGNAFYQKQQFYPSVVYITKSNPSMAVLYVQAFIFVVLMGKLFRKIFFGQLRAAEMEHLIERSWYAVTETCLAFTVFRDDFSPRFVALFTLLLFLKCFHWLAEDRVDYMERSPVISYLFHFRVMSLLSVLSLLDMYFVNHAYYSTLTKGASVQLVFGFEYAILMTIIMMSLMKYLLHSIDLQSENPWENKAVYLLYSELILGFIKVILYMTFMVIMIKVHTFPLFAIRPMYLSVRAFKKALHDVIMSRRAIRQMNTLYPDVSEEELQAGDNVCIICREEMLASCKKLPCNHIFHTSCLRSWFQRQQTCPTCRMEVLRMPQPQAPPQAAPPGHAPYPQQQQPGQVPLQNMFPGGFPPMPGQPFVWPPQQAAQPQQQQAGPSPPSSSATSSPAATSTAQSPSQPSTAGAAPFTMPSPAASASTMPGVMPMFPPMFMPNSFPRPPSNLAGLSEEELRAMEGTERENLEARIQWLRDIQGLLDGAMLLMQQYNTVAANSSIPSINLARSTQAAAAASAGSPSTSQTTTFSNTGPRWSVASGGARPKQSSPAEASNPQSKASSVEKDDKTDLSELEGASGFTAPKEEVIPTWEDPRKEEHSDEMDEIRRRRLERFLSDSSSETKVNHTHED